MRKYKSSPWLWQTENQIKTTVNRYDGRIKATIIHILDEFFKRNKDNAILYTCLTEDGMSRNRRDYLGRWFKWNGR